MLEPKDFHKTILLDPAEFALRIAGVRKAMTEDDSRPQALLLCDFANMFDLTGRVFRGWVYIPLEGDVICFVQRPLILRGENTVAVRKPEEIPAHLCDRLPATIGLELDTASWNEVKRLKALFPDATLTNASAVMRRARAVKTPAQIEQIRQSGISHVRVYSRIPKLYRDGMTDIELQVEIERVSRLEGGLGQFRISGNSMELFQGSILVGENADTPSPYDFALGGEGMNPSLPVGANGTEITPGTTVMVDMGGNFTGYMTDMSRVFSLGEIPETALKAHQTSIDIHRMLQVAGKPGVKASELYEGAMDMVKERGLEQWFMGHTQKAGFIGHGVGIEINELPVIAPRSRDILAKGNVIALEPKFVIPHVGAVGIENTYYVDNDGLKLLTPAPEEIIKFDL